MVDTDQEPLQKGEPVKKKKETPKKPPAKGKTVDKGVLKKLLTRKDDNAVKAQSSAKVSAVQKGQSVVKLKKFFKGAWSELKKVHWPNRREIISFTSVVLVAVTIVAILIFAVDSLLSKTLEYLIPK